jgi:murein DD-endopeptidase MepM/ murein hydrolase activator NlpD
VASARDTLGPPSGAELAPTSDRFGNRPDRMPVADRRVGQQRTAPTGETIQVQQGDTLYGIAKRHGVSIAALIEVNGLQHGSTIKPGQELTLPAGASPARAAPEPARVPGARVAPPAAAPAASTPPPAGWDGRHTMKAGESLYGIARQHRVPLAELQRINGITEPTRVRVGTVLHVPGGPEAGGARDQPPPAPVASAPSAPPRVVQSAPTGPGQQPRIINAPAEPAKYSGLGAADTVAPASEASPARFRWPVKGRIIAAYGKRPDGTHNDGINVAVPQGTDVHAAEGGRVAYAGNELKGYGNLILIRHDNGWVSAYAHSDQMLVQRDDVVRRGQVIAKAGRSGSVDQPQLHFELRQGAKPVDPLPHMEKN